MQVFRRYQWTYIRVETELRKLRLKQGDDQLPLLGEPPPSSGVSGAAAASREDGGTPPRVGNGVHAVLAAHSGHAHAT
jgi:hypothetical protein